MKFCPEHAYGIGGDVTTGELLHGEVLVYRDVLQVILLLVPPVRLSAISLQHKSKPICQASQVSVKIIVAS